MNTAVLTRSWPTLAAWGAGLIQLALGAGMVMGTDAGATAAGVVLVVVGLSGLAWGLASLALGRVVLPWGGVAIAIAGTITGVGGLVVDPAHVSVLAVAVGSALWIVVGVASALALRSEQQRRPASSSRLGLIGLLAGAVVVAAAVTPALGATEAGQMAPDHSSHSIDFGGGGHQH